MRQRFEEPTHQPLNTDMGQRFDAPEERHQTRTNAGGINFGLVAIFGLPLLIIAGLLQSTTKFVDIFEGTEELQANIDAAQKQGFPILASELAKISAGKTNSAPVLQKYFLDKKRPLSAKHLALVNLVHAPSAELAPGLKTLIGYAHEIAACETFDPKYDFDLSYSLLLPEYAQMKQVVRILNYEALMAAKSGDAKTAVRALTDARRVCTQLVDEQMLIGMLVAVSSQALFYRAVADVGIEFADRPDVLAQLRDLAQADIPVPAMDKALQTDYYATLAYLRNLERSGGMVSAIALNGNGYAEPNLTLPIVRKGLPKSAVAQGLLAKALAHFQKLVEIARTEPDPVKAGKMMDEYSAHLDNTLANVFSGLILPVFRQASSARAKPSSYHAMSDWAIEIEAKYQGKYPASLPSRFEPGLGGKLIFKPLGRKFLLYSTGYNRLDEGGPKGFQKGPVMPTDDYGMVFPLEIDPNSKKKPKLFEGGE